jgi:hypothetical protein
MLAAITTLAGWYDVGSGMIPAFANRNDVVLCEPLHFVSAIDAAMSISCFDLLPLDHRQVVDCGLSFASTFALSLGLYLVGICLGIGFYGSFNFCGIILVIVLGPGLTFFGVFVTSFFGFDAYFLKMSFFVTLYATLYRICVTFIRLPGVLFELFRVSMVVHLESFCTACLALKTITPLLCPVLTKACDWLRLLTASTRQFIGNVHKAPLIQAKGEHARPPGGISTRDLRRVPPYPARGV